MAASHILHKFSKFHEFAAFNFVDGGTPTYKN